MSNTTSRETKKTTTYRMYIKLHGQPFEVDEMCTKESAQLRSKYESEYHGVIRTKIKSSILEKALEFCKKRGEIKIHHHHHHHHKDIDDDKKQLILQDKLKDFDSDFLKQIKQSDDADAIILHLIDAACKMEIDSLLELLLDDAIEIICHKTPEDIKKIFYVHYNGDDRLFDYMKDLMGYARWGLT